MRLLSITMLGLALQMPPADAETRSLITGRNPQEVQEKAFDRDMDYPVGPLRCSQRCSQWWARE